MCHGARTGARFPSATPTPIICVYTHHPRRRPPMLVALGFLMVATFMALIMTKRMTPLLALIIVPTVFGLFAGAGVGIGDMVMDAVKDMSSTAALLMFAIIYFGLMIDV